MATGGTEAAGPGLLLRWGALVVLLVLGGLLVAARALDDYTTAFGLLLALFGVVLGLRLAARAVP